MIIWGKEMLRSSIFYKYFIWVFLFQLLTSSNSFSETSKELPGIKWEHRLGDAHLLHNATAMVLSQENGRIFIAGTSTLAARTGESAKFWVWEINQNGEKTKEIEIKNPLGDKRLNSGYSYVKDIFELRNGELILIIEFNPGQPSLVRIGESGVDSNIIFIKELSEQGSYVVLNKILPLRDGNLLLIGSNRDNAYLLSSGISGKIVWDKNIDYGKTDFFIDGIPIEEGGALLIGNSGLSDQKGIWSSDLLITKVNSSGKKIKEISFSGRHGNVTKGHNNGYVIVYDKSKSMSQDIWVREMDSDLNIIWETQLLTVEPGFTEFKIARVPSSGYVVTGSNRSRLWVAGVDNKGEKIWSYTDEFDPKTMKPWNSGSNAFISKDSEFFVLTSVISENENRKSNNKVGIIKFIQK